MWSPKYHPYSKTVRNNQSALEDYLNRQYERIQAQIDDIVRYLHSLSPAPKQEFRVEVGPVEVEGDGRISFSVSIVDQRNGEGA